MDTIRKITDYLTLQKPQALIELYGSEQSVIDEQKLRYQTLLTRFTHHFPGKNVQIFSSPGRTEIGGNHTDHNHGRVLAGAINLDTIAMAAANDTPTIHIKSTGYPDIILDTTKLDSNPAEQFASISLVRGICSRIKQLGYHIGGFDACIDGKIPRGSGLSSSASFEVLIATIINHLFNKGEIDAMQCALISQYAENTYFGKPCGLMDQITCSVGGLITIDFQDPKHPVVKKINFNFQSTDFHLVITDTGGSHADLNEEYTSIPLEMKSVANALWAHVLQEVDVQNILEAIPRLRKTPGDRAILRALHFQAENQRVAQQVEALERNDFNAFLQVVVDSGYSSYMYNQNIYLTHNIREQGVSLALALSELILKWKWSWRVHWGGFAGTIQAFIPSVLLDNYTDLMTQVFGKNSCHKIAIQNQGAGRIILPFKS